MATAKLKRKPRLSKIESYKAANTKEVQFRVSPQILCRSVHSKVNIMNAQNDEQQQPGIYMSKTTQNLRRNYTF